MSRKNCLVVYLMLIGRVVFTGTDIAGYEEDDIRCCADTSRRIAREIYGT
jgi:hypothetical protein